MRAIYRSSAEKGDRMLHVGNGTLGALSARGTFGLVFPGVARNALTPGYFSHYQTLKPWALHKNY